MVKRIFLAAFLFLAGHAMAVPPATPTVTVTPVLGRTQHVETFDIAGRGAKDFSRLAELQDADVIVVKVENLNDEFMDVTDGYNAFTLRPNGGSFTFGNLTSETVMSWKAQGPARLTIFYWK